MQGYYPLPSYETLKSYNYNFDENQDWILEKAMEGVNRFVDATNELLPFKIKELIPTVGHDVVKYLMNKFSRNGCTNMTVYYVDHQNIIHFDTMQKGDYDKIRHTYDWDEDYNQPLFEWLCYNCLHFGENTEKWTDYSKIICKSINFSMYSQMTKSVEEFEKSFSTELTYERLLDILRKKYNELQHEWLMHRWDRYPDDGDRLKGYRNIIGTAMMLLETRIAVRDHKKKGYTMDEEEKLLLEAENAFRKC